MSLQTETVRLKERAYDCGFCGSVHRYGDGSIFALHRDLAASCEWWIIEVIE